MAYESQQQKNAVSWTALDGTGGIGGGAGGNRTNTT